MRHRSSRRQFVLGWGAACFAGRPAAAEEPFDFLPPGVWQRARMNGLIMIHRPAPARLSGRTQLVGDREPGEPLIVTGQVFAPDGRTPAPGVTVYAYNTNAEGYYGENRAEYPPRLFGWMQSGPTGNFEFRTIRPGRYPGMHVPAHVHFAFWGGGYPLQGGAELRFTGDSYLSPSDMAEDRLRGELREIRPVTRRSDGCSFARSRSSWAASSPSDRNRASDATRGDRATHEPTHKTALADRLASVAGRLQFINRYRVSAARCPDSLWLV
jgi:hypothetical protein